MTPDAADPLIDHVRRSSARATPAPHRLTAHDELLTHQLSADHALAVQLAVDVEVVAGRVVDHVGDVSRRTGDAVPSERRRAAGQRDLPGGDARIDLDRRGRPRRTGAMNVRED